MIIFMILAGGVGAVVRYRLNGVISRRSRLSWPLGSFVINVTGSFLLAAVAGAVVCGLLPEDVRVIVETGFLGGYTTFSSACLETAELIAHRRHKTALLHSVAMLVTSLVAATIGMWVSSLFFVR